MERTKYTGQTKAAVTPVQPVEPTSDVDAKVLWVNTGGLFHMKDGTVIQRKEKFAARPSDVPKAFRGVIKPLEPLPIEVPPVKTGDSYRARERKDGFFDIVDSRGKVVNDKPMRDDEAKSVLAKLN